jgi:hypothetical protein
MIDAEMSFTQVDVVATPARARRLPRLAGLGLAGVISAGLWAVLAVAAVHIL